MSQLLTVPLPTINEYAVLTSGNVNVGDRNTLSGGDIGIAATRQYAHRGHGFARGSGRGPAFPAHYSATARRHG